LLLGSSSFAFRVVALFGRVRWYYERSGFALTARTASGIGFDRHREPEYEDTIAVLLVIRYTGL